MMDFLVLAVLFLLKQDAVSSVRLLELRVPAHAAEGGEAILGCQFDMENDVLYSVKWYKDGREFYRYVPVSSRPISHFATPGVKVDVSRSSNTVVTLVHLTQESSGLYRCEVSGEAPLFATVYDEKFITIYLLPETGPQLAGLREFYKIGERVRANCTSLGSRPEAQLKWLINNRPAPKNYLRGPWYRASQPDAVETIVELTFYVGSKHFRLGTLDLKCQATIAPLYQQETVHKASKDEISDLDSYTDAPSLGEQPLPTFPDFGDISQLQFEDVRLEDEKDGAASRSPWGVLFLTFMTIIQILV